MRRERCSKRVFKGAAEKEKNRGKTIFAYSFSGFVASKHRTQVVLGKRETIALWRITRLLHIEGYRSRSREKEKKSADRFTNEKIQGNPLQDQDLNPRGPKEGRKSETPLWEAKRVMCAAIGKTAAFGKMGGLETCGHAGSRQSRKGRMKRFVGRCALDPGGGKAWESFQIRSRVSGRTEKLSFQCTQGDGMCQSSARMRGVASTRCSGRAGAAQGLRKARL